MAEAPKKAATTERIHRMSFGEVYPLYVQKAERKARSRAEVDEIIAWLTGYDGAALKREIEAGSDFEAFFGHAPRINPDASKVTGLICGVRVEELEDRTERLVRCLDKLVDELAKGRPMEKILRKQAGSS